MQNDKKKYYHCAECGVAMDHNIVKHLTPEDVADPDTWVWCATEQDLVPREQWLALYEESQETKESPRQVRTVIRPHVRWKNGQAYFVTQHCRKRPSGE